MSAVENTVREVAERLSAESTLKVASGSLDGHSKGLSIAVPFAKIPGQEQNQPKAGPGALSPDHAANCATFNATFRLPISKGGVTAAAGVVS